jgi:hypothetical protein
MKVVRVLLLVAFCFTGLALAQKVTYQYDRGVDFSRFHTYKWVTMENNPQISQITAENITTLVNTQLAQKGLVLAPEGQDADIYVAVQVSVKQQQQLNWFSSGGPWFGSMGSATTSTIDTGTLVVDFYNPTQRQLVWRGTAARTINPSGNADKNYANLQKAIAKLLKDFPPPVNK